MLFSNAEVAKILSEEFECAWESVRPVPKAEIDFGNGIRLTRTLQGNVATYLCTPDGRVADIIPGVMDADTYVTRARAGAALVHAILPIGVDRKAVVTSYHRELASAPTTADIARRVAEMKRHADYGKMRVEYGVREALMSALAEVAGADERKDGVEDPLKESLAADTKHNQEVRMPKIHALLAENPLATPADYKIGLFREILGCDLEDPYLGLAPLVLGGEVGRTK